MFDFSRIELRPSKFTLSAPFGTILDPPALSKMIGIATLNTQVTHEATRLQANVVLKLAILIFCPAIGRRCKIVHPHYTTFTILHSNTLQIQS